MSPTCTGRRKLISSIAAVTAGPSLCRKATAPAVESASFMISPPWTLPRMLACTEVAAIARETREKDTGRAVTARHSCRHGSVSAMAERPPGKGGPEEGTPEYDWLYGKGGKGSPAAGADDATRMVPAAGPSGPPPAPGRDPGHAGPAAYVVRRAAGGRRAGPPSAAAAPLPRRAPRRERRRPRLRLRHRQAARARVDRVHGRRAVLGVDQDRQGRRRCRAADRPGDQPGTNYLIVGSDKADDLTEAAAQGARHRRRGGTNTDTIIVLHTGSGPDTMMSIPRDTLAEVPGHGTQMINSAFALRRAPLLVQTVEELTGIHIDHYVELGFGSVINTVDAVGGVEICPKAAT